MKMHLLSSLQMREALLKSARRESSGPTSVHTLDLPKQQKPLLPSVWDGVHPFHLQAPASSPFPLSVLGRGCPT